VARRRLTRGLAALALMGGAAQAEALRVAAFNAALSRAAPGALVQELRLGDSRQIAAVAEIIQRVRPDILLINEIDFDPDGVSARLFAEALRIGRGGAEAIDYPHIFVAPVNTGVLTGFDLDGDGAVTRPRDAHGYGLHEGHYGMALFSRFAFGAARTFQTLRWAEMPGARTPPGRYAPEAAAALRLSSKSHWDVAVTAPFGPLHVLASHPTPPVFEPANVARNADEIRFWVDYLNGADWMVDDAGRRGGANGAPVVVLGDLNADPADGDGRDGAIRALLAHPRLQDPAPGSEGGAAAATPGHRGDPARDTADWREDGGPGNLRVDYVLPSRDLRVLGAGVFWPAPGDPLRRLVGEGAPVRSSDHRLVWVDVTLP